MFHRINDLSKERGVSPGVIVREAMALYLGGNNVPAKIDPIPREQIPHTKKPREETYMNAPIRELQQIDTDRIEKRGKPLNYKD